MEIERVITEIRPTLESLEVERQTVKAAQKKFFMIMLPVVIVVAAVAVIFFPFGLIAVFVGLIGGGIVHHQMVGKPLKAFVNDYKTTVLSKLVKLVDPSLQYSANRGIQREVFINSELFTTRPDRFHTEDLIAGNHGQTSVQLAEVVAKERRTSRDSKGRTKTRYVTFFRGLLLIADFHKHFHGRTFVFPDTAESLFGGFGRTLQSFGGRSGTKLAQMENVEFEKEFAIYTSDQVEARYILTPSMMERLLLMRQRFGKDVRVAFKQSSVWIAVPHSEPYLEPTHHVSTTDTKQIRRMLDEVLPFLDIIDELDLNTRIWTKQ